MTAKKAFFALILSAVVLVPFTTSAQITIGSGHAPSEWSLLDLCTNAQRKALHNARMTTEQRNNLMSNLRCPSDEYIHNLKDQARAQGLLIFNTSNDCLEFWNGRQWITLCGPVEITPEPSGNAHVTTFVTVMYDFQTQPFETFYEGSAAPESWRWQVSTNNFNWTDIAGASGGGFAPTTEPGIFSAVWNGFPVDFIHNYAENVTVLYFRSIVNTAEGEYVTQLSENTLRIHFIRTTVSGGTSAFRPGFGMTDEVRWADIGSGNSAVNPVTGQPNSIRAALLNVGGSSCDGGLGSHFQWGRRADGHQLMGWYNDPVTLITTFTSGVNGTSSVIPRADFVNDGGNFNAAGNQPNPADTNFLTANQNDWSTQDVANINNWGGPETQLPTRINSPAHSDNWRFPDNNPCLPGWRVPSRWEWWDMNIGDGTNEHHSGSGDQATGWGTLSPSNNTWTWYDIHTGALGGAVVRHSSGGAIFLPAASMRMSGTGVRWHGEMDGRYWSSTQNSNAGVHTNAGTLSFSNSNVAAGYFHTSRAQGLSVRCVAETQ